MMGGWSHSSTPDLAPLPVRQREAGAVFWGCWPSPTATPKVYQLPPPVPCLLCSPLPPSPGTLRLRAPALSAGSITKVLQEGDPGETQQKTGGHTCLFPELPVLHLDRWQEIRSFQTTGRQFFTVFANLSKRTIVIFNQTEPPPKTGPSLVLRKSLTVRAAVIILTLGLAASILLQAVLYPWFMSTISNVKNNAQLLKGRVDNISALGSEIKRNRGGVEATGIQVQKVNASLDHVRSQIWKLETGVKEANAQIQMLTRSWEAVNDLNAQIPELKRNLDKASSLNAKVQGLQTSLENISKVLKQQNDILQMVSQGWKYFKGNFYYFSQVPKTWYSAQQFCVSRDSHLTSVASESEQEFLYKMAGGLFYWIGLTKAGSEGDWYWVDDTPFNKVQSARFWIPGEDTVR
ncbi:C-type lectin domain family 4 member K isoform X2 [Prionailurus bengalensis]|uniref:C-type lectin domain family 4 member K isoform X2 n=1 Tax=Prionailurus bengalensis TaxID=37029 RepID=UPI001CA88365|nr:C-type lectin domain family 4 member K isoform X2 [Prionailurus bengalensis]